MTPRAAARPIFICSTRRCAPEPAIADRDRELSAQDVKLMRFLLDRALQPLEAFDGFEWLDQFQTAAVRYQLNFIGYALSMAQANASAPRSAAISTPRSGG